MWLHRFTSYILQYRYRAIAITFFIAFLPVIGVMSILIAALVTLRKSVTEGALFTLAATLPYLLSFYVTGPKETESLLLVWAAAGIAVTSNIVTWAFAALLRKGTNFSVCLQIAALLGVLVVSVIHLAYPNIADWWAQELQAYYSQASAIMVGMIKSPTVQGDSQIETISVVKQYTTGLMVAAILFNAFLQVIAARWWQAVIFNPGGLKRELHYIRLTQLAGVLFLVSLLLSYLGNSVILDIMPVLYLLFIAAGLSLLHYLATLTNAGWFWLMILYITLVWLFPFSMLLVAMLALIDIWMDIRKRAKQT